MSARTDFGVPESATADEVRSRWKHLASLHHPDKGGDAAKFIEYRTLYHKALAEAMEPVKCQECGGSGKITVRRGFSSLSIFCSTCHGTGHA